MIWDSIKFAFQMYIPYTTDLTQVISPLCYIQLSTNAYSGIFIHWSVSQLATAVLLSKSQCISIHTYVRTTIASRSFKVLLLLFCIHSTTICIYCVDYSTHRVSYIYIYRIPLLALYVVPRSAQKRCSPFRLDRTMNLIMHRTTGSTASGITQRPNIWYNIDETHCTWGDRIDEGEGGRGDRGRGRWCQVRISRANVYIYAEIM